MEKYPLTLSCNTATSYPVLDICSSQSSFLLKHFQFRLNSPNDWTFPKKEGAPGHSLLYLFQFKYILFEMWIPISFEPTGYLYNFVFQKANSFPILSFKSPGDKKVWGCDHSHCMHSADEYIRAQKMLLGMKSEYQSILCKYIMIASFLGSSFDSDW